MAKTAPQASRPKLAIVQPRRTYRDDPICSALAERVNDLRARRRALVAELVELDPTGARPDHPDPRHANERAAREMLGDADATPQPPAPDRRIEIEREIAVIDVATEIGESRQFQARVAALAALREEYEPEYRAVVREIALTLVRLELLLDQRDQLARDLGGHLSGLACQLAPVGGSIRRSETASYGFIQAAIRAGYVAPADLAIAEEKNNVA